MNPATTETQKESHLRGRLEWLEEAVDISLAAGNPPGQSLLRGRVKRLEESVGDIHEAQATMEQSLRALSLARLQIKRALNDVISDLATLSAQ